MTHPVTRTHWRRDGDGPAIVLLHGVGLDLTMWDPVADRLAAERTVIRLDMYGHGQTPKVLGELSLQDFAEQVAWVAGAAEVDRFDLVGFSMGALVAQAFVRRHAGRAGRLVLMGGVYNRSPLERDAVLRRLRTAEEEGPASLVEPALARWFAPGFLDRSPEVGAAVRKRLMANDHEGFLQAYRVFAQADRDICGHETSLVGPVLVATGELDSGSTPVMAQSLAAALPMARALIWLGLAHLAPLQDPDTVTDAIRQFCSVDRMES